MRSWPGVGALVVAVACGGGGGGGADAPVGADAAPADAAFADAGVDGPIDPCAAGCPADTWDIDANPLTGTCGCEYSCVFVAANDPIDPAFTDDNCDGGDGMVEQCV